MKMQIVAIVAIMALALVSLTGCKSDADKFAAHVDAMADIVKDAGDDCDKAEKGLESYVKDNEEDIKKLGEKLKEGGTEGDKKTLEESFENFGKASEKCPQTGLYLLVFAAAVAGE